MDDEERNKDWLDPLIPLSPDGRYHRVRYEGAELRDFGRDMGLLFRDTQEYRWAVALSRPEAQQLFDQLWQWHYRPSEE